MWSTLTTVVRNYTRLHSNPTRLNPSYEISGAFGSSRSLARWYNSATNPLMERTEGLWMERGFQSRAYHYVKVLRSNIFT